ncbi:MAG: nuclear transport factor 2 family protein [Chitinophagaceae bacterium]
MIKYFCVLIAYSLLSNAVARAQTAEDSVKAVINQMFEAMKNADPVALKNVFADSALLQSISRSNEGKTIVRNEPIAEFIELIGKQPSGASDERIIFESIKTDGSLASAWTPYAFYYNGQLHHCGVNSFQLVKINNSWKIQYIIDTRRKEGCP